MKCARSSNWPTFSINIKPLETVVALFLVSLCKLILLKCFGSPPAGCGPWREGVVVLAALACSGDNMIANITITTKKRFTTCRQQRAKKPFHHPEKMLRNVDPIREDDLNMINLHKYSSPKEICYKTARPHRGRAVALCKNPFIEAGMPPAVSRVLGLERLPFFLRDASRCWAFVFLHLHPVYPFGGGQVNHSFIAPGITPPPTTTPQYLTPASPAHPAGGGKRGKWQ